jgi:hypothetical protein
MISMVRKNCQAHFFRQTLGRKIILSFFVDLLELTESKVNSNYSFRVTAAKVLVVLESKLFFGFVPYSIILLTDIFN